MKTWKTSKAAAAAILSAALLAGCSSGTASTTDNSATIDPKAVEPKSLIGLGPNGEKPALTSDVKLTAEQTAKVRAGKFKVGISMQTMDIDFAKVQTTVLKKTFEENGVQVIGITDAQWKAEKQIGDLENLIQQKPNGILGVPVDDVATAAAFSKVGQSGMKLVMIDQVPKGLKYPTDYQASVQADGKGNGQVAAEMLASRIPKDGTMGMVNFGNDIFATNERTKGAKEWLAKNRPDIKIKETAFSDPAKAGQVGGDFVTANPDIKGLWVVWDAPALEVISALRGQGANIPVATIDLGQQLTAEIAQGADIVGVGAQRLTDQAKAEANAMMLALIGESTPSYIAAPALAVTKSNLTDSFKIVFDAPAPSDIVDTCKKNPGCK
ncbi:substrate-binding domain-containing protein [Arthrobacter bambusae]|uniref:Ribose transport system substrate-binding protein n=1 Tax=Arthrobacter bambusae TaxID=1338426 RepID=A0AAW8DLX0_9MICC|nr:substrate-binding domain-containing protein [Arthrobacter bambusae]MDP9907269.1 ribose transport system substrate-binding protein [Arthrobacter bambusae]MDQ0131405.1 ribose transport system substrate-binding protein [Arthrobacter bambusae]MDQ0182739.1 ribose transport system substrate-binding protein [Arthrobacter bambusae]